MTLTPKCPGCQRALGHARGCQFATGPDALRTEAPSDPGGARGTDPVQPNTRGHLIYRCRYCAGIEKRLFADIAQGVIDELENHHGLGSHTCPNGTVGVLDLICALPEVN